MQPPSSFRSSELFWSWPTEISKRSKSPSPGTRHPTRGHSPPRVLTPTPQRDDLHACQKWVKKVLFLQRSSHLPTCALGPAYAQLAPGRLAPDHRQGRVASTGIITFYRPPYTPHIRQRTTRGSTRAHTHIASTLGPGNETSSPRLDNRRDNRKERGGTGSAHTRRVVNAHREGLGAKEACRLLGSRSGQPRAL